MEDTRQPKRQGDIRLVPTDNQPGKDRTYRLRKRGEGLIIAAGEATGHHHRVRDSKARVFVRDGREFLRVSKNGATLEHEEHAPIALESGTFEITRQREMMLPPPRDKQDARPVEVRTQRVWD